MVLKSLLLMMALSLRPYARAGPAFQTDDPEPVGFRHYEAYLFGTFDHAGGATFSQVPAVEFNWGAAPNLQVHIIVPGAFWSPNGAYGIGDAEMGVKYRTQRGANCAEEESVVFSSRPAVVTILQRCFKECRQIDEADIELLSLRESARSSVPHWPWAE